MVFHFCFYEAKSYFLTKNNILPILGQTWVKIRIQNIFISIKCINSLKEEIINE